MTNRALFLAVGAAWGVLLGGLAGWALPTIAIFAGIPTFAMCMTAGWIYGGRVSSPTADRRRARRTGFALLALCAVTSAAIVAISMVGIERQRADREQGKARQEAFARLSEDRHTIDRIDFFGWNADAGSMGIVMRGNRNGDYRIIWQVTEATYDQVLAAGRKSVSLGPGRRTVVIGIERGVLIAAYREKVLGDTGGGGVKVNEEFRFAATVEPILSADESAAMPPREVRNLAKGRSSLRKGGVVVDVAFPVDIPPTGAL